MCTFHGLSDVLREASGWEGFRNQRGYVLKVRKAIERLKSCKSAMRPKWQASVDSNLDHLPKR